MNIHYYFFQASILSINNINNFITVFQNIDYIIVDSKLIIIPETSINALEDYLNQLNLR